MPERKVDTQELKRRIAAGEYRVDAHAIAEAMFGRADRDIAAMRPSEVLEAGKLRRSTGGVE